MLSTIKFPIIIAWQVDSIYLFNIIWSMRLKLIWFTNYVGYRSAFPGASVYFCSCEMHLLRLFPFTASRINSLCFRILFTHVWKGSHKPTTRQFSCNRINVRTQSFIIHLICNFFFFLYPLWKLTHHIRKSIQNALIHSKLVPLLGFGKPTNIKYL